MMLNNGDRFVLADDLYYNGDWMLERNPDRKYIDCHGIIESVKIVGETGKYTVLFDNGLRGEFMISDNFLPDVRIFDMSGLKELI